MNMKTVIILLASGSGKRFGSNKLLAFVGGKRLLDYSVEAALKSSADGVIAVCSPEVAEYLSKSSGIVTVINDSPDEGMSRSIRLGVEKARRDFDHVVIAVTDQPLKSSALFDMLIRTAKENPVHPVCASISGEPRSPSIFPSVFYDKLMAIRGDVGARNILRKEDSVIKVEVDRKTLLDIDTPEDLRKIEEILESENLPDK